MTSRCLTSVVVLVLAGGCGPAVESPSESDGGSGSSGEVSSSDGGSGAGSGGSATDGGTATTGDSGGGSPGNPTATDGAVPCEVPTQERGPELIIEVVNGFEGPIVLAGEGCDQPLRLRTAEQQPVNWDPDCGWPVCTDDVGGWGCAVCDCGQVTIFLEPGESTRFTWAGENYDLVDTDPACGQCETCWASSLAPGGIYEAIIPFYEYCEPGPGCEVPDVLQELTARFEYPGDLVVIDVSP